LSIRFSINFDLVNRRALAIDWQDFAGSYTDGRPTQTAAGQQDSKNSAGPE
jgi:hypothetical protein